MDSSPRQSNIHDVARRAGVSISTVSQALNNKGRVSAETQQRIIEAADELNYRPMSSARSLRGGRSGMIALTLTEPPRAPIAVTDFDYFRRLNDGATSAALSAGLALVTLPSRSAPEMITTTQLDGAIVVDPIPDDPSLKQLRALGIPLVTAGRGIDDENDDWVDNDHDAATRAVLDHLRLRGAKRIALLTVPPVHSYAVDMRQTYEAWCFALQAPVIVEQAAAATTEMGGMLAARRLFARDEPPDAIYAGLDGQALGVLIAAESAGISVPDDLMIVCCTDSQSSAHASPPLTALNLHPEALGHQAVELLIAQIENRSTEAIERLVPWTLIERGSTSPS